MEHPFRDSENERIIIDSRLSALEEKAAGRTMWRRIGLLFGVISAVAHLVTLYYLRKPAEPAACHDVVKTVEISAFSRHADVTCDHPRQKGTLVAHTNREITLQCMCQ